MERLILKDGLYVVTYGTITAGFTVKGGYIIQCAPILRKRLAMWIRFAKRIGD